MYRDLESENTHYAFSNVILSAFISSRARLRLYGAMSTVGIARLLYCDTDSIIYVRRRDQSLLLPLGDYLGQLKDELPPGWEMRLFTARGPKHYSYELKEVSTGQLDHVIKICGITLNQRTRLKITFKDMYQVGNGTY